MGRGHSQSVVGDISPEDRSGNVFVSGEIRRVIVLPVTHMQEQ